MNTGVDVLDRTVQETSGWIGELAESMGSLDRHAAYSALRAVLVTLRDRIGADNAAHLAAQLPLMVRGVFYDGFRPSATPTRERTREEFLRHVNRAVTRGLPVDPEQAVRAVLDLLASRIDAAEVAKLQRLMPEELREFWPQPLH